MKIFDPGSVVPTRISGNAWEAATTITREVEMMLHDYGFHAHKELRKTTIVIAKMVQLAINRSHDADYRSHPRHK